MASLVSLGPNGDNWVYNGQNHVCDLTRNANASSGARCTFATTQGEDILSGVVIAPSKTALVVVDMQNFFLHPRCNDHPAGLAAAERIRGVIERCRMLGIKVRAHIRG
jgi:phosphatidylethanolamine-binding protein